MIHQPNNHFVLETLQSPLVLLTNILYLWQKQKNFKIRKMPHVVFQPYAHRIKSTLNPSQVFLLNIYIIENNVGFRIVVSLLLAVFF